MTSDSPPERPAEPQRERAIRSALYEDGSWKAGETTVPAEEAVTLRLNGRELVTMLATPGQRHELAVGFLYAEGVLDAMAQLQSVEVVDDGVEVRAEGVDLGVRLFDRRVLGSGCGKATAFVTGLEAFAGRARALPDELPWVSPAVVTEAAQVTYGGAGGLATTRGTHAAALFDRQGALVVATEDIGRHNAVDKVIGHCLLGGVALGELFLVVTGRISSEMAGKVARTPIPLVVSKSVPTALALEYAERLHVGIVGRVRRSSLTVFAWPELLAGAAGAGAGGAGPDGGIADGGPEDRRGGGLGGGPEDSPDGGSASGDRA